MEAVTVVPVVVNPGRMVAIQNEPPMNVVQSAIVVKKLENQLLVLVVGTVLLTIALSEEIVWLVTVTRIGTVNGTGNVVVIGMAIENAKKNEIEIETGRESGIKRRRGTEAVAVVLMMRIEILEKNVKLLLVGVK